MPSVRHGVSALCAFSLTVCLSATPAAWADPSTTSSTSSTSVASTGSSTSSTSTAPGPPGTGVPSVPVGGPATTTTTLPKGTPPPTPTTSAPPNPQPVLVDVQDDLAQIQAIDDYQPALAAVNADQKLVAAAAAGVQRALNAEEDAKYVQAQEVANSKDADARLRGLAIEAYIGVGFVSPNGSAHPATPGPGPAGVTGIQAVDANEMLIIVADDARRNVANARHLVKTAAKYVKAAQAGVVLAQKKQSQAEVVLAAGRASLKIVTDAAVSAQTASKTKLPVFATTTTTVPGGASPPTTPFDTIPTPFATVPTTTDALTAKVVGSTTTSTTLSPSVIDSLSPTILGSPVLNGSALAAWFASTGRQANTTVPMAQLAQDYDYWGQQFGVRDDLAFAQSIVETGFFSFPAGGQLTGQDNNFAGIGACDSCSTGWSFPDAKTGVGAQIELLHAYATNVAVPNEPNFIGNGGVGGCCQTWMALAGKWASSLVYGISIMTIYNQMLTWYIPQRLVQLGLVKPPPTTGGASGSASPTTGAPSTTVANQQTSAASIQFAQP